ncbi:hypothetical protein GCM10023310_70120 [Paenibacillus vulneris]|uniref:Uncharacterized protein n=1 Tax=Paenibacillus vulneris TaxID=1133364 RepID=A0ABW3UG99_9BACL
MPKYQLRTLVPNGTPRSEYPTKDQVREVLATVNATLAGHDEILGAYVVCDRKPKDFPQYSSYWVEI